MSVIFASHALPGARYETLGGTPVQIIGPKRAWGKPSVCAESLITGNRIAFPETYLLRPYSGATSKQEEETMSKKAKKQKEAKAPRGARFKFTDGNLTRTYKGVVYVVISSDGIITCDQYGAEAFRSLTALAQKITGYKNISGPAFFDMMKKDPAVAA